MLRVSAGCSSDYVTAAPLLVATSFDSLMIRMSLYLLFPVNTQEGRFPA